MGRIETAFLCGQLGTGVLDLRGSYAEYTEGGMIGDHDLVSWHKEYLVDKGGYLRYGYFEKRPYLYSVGVYSLDSNFRRINPDAALTHIELWGQRRSVYHPTIRSRRHDLPILVFDQPQYESSRIVYNIVMVPQGTNLLEYHQEDLGSCTEAIGYYVRDSNEGMKRVIEVSGWSFPACRKQSWEPLISRLAYLVSILSPV